jgi:hypothetical protein
MLKSAIIRNLDELSAKSVDELVAGRYGKFRAYGRFLEGVDPKTLVPPRDEEKQEEEQPPASAPLAEEEPVA